MDNTCGVKMKIVAIIPARLASTRFPGKILFHFHGLPMIEHVRRRALLSKAVSEVYVATCDEEIALVIRGFGGKVIMTAKNHANGTTRVAEAVKNIDCTHVMLLQGDEPLLLPRHIDLFAQAMESNLHDNAWNATGPIEHESELDRHSFVKCAVGLTDYILYCFRRTPCYSSYDVQRSFVRKMLGIMAFRKEFLLKLIELPASVIEQAESIEQMRIIENGYSMRSVQVSPSLPSVNEPSEADIVLDYIQHNDEQRALLELVIRQ